MTSQDPVTSKSHTFQDHHGDERSRLQSAARADRFLFLGIFRTVPRPFPVSLFLSFLLSFCFFEIERFQFPFLVSLLFLFVLVHGHFCSVVVGVSISQPPFPSSQHFLRKMHKHDECWLQGDLLVTCTIWRNESATLTQLCQNTSYRRLQVCCRGGSAAGGQQANSSSIVGGREAGIHAHEWKQQAPLPHCRFKKSRQASPSLWTDKAKSPYACRFASTSNDHSISEGETELQTFQGDTHIANRKDQATEY